MKTVFKKVKAAMTMVVVAPLTLPELAARRITGRNVFFRAQTEILSLIPGTIGMVLRGVYYHMMLRRCPIGCRIKFGATIFPQAEFGERVEVGRYAVIGEATIGDDCMIAQGAQIWSGKLSHGISDSRVPFSEQLGIVNRVSIGRNCWIGGNAIVMADIGENCVVGAGAIVTRPFPSGKIIVGNPARAVVDTFDPRLIEGRKAKQNEVQKLGRVQEL